jgi:hypothetical protein
VDEVDERHEVADLPDLHPAAHERLEQLVEPDHGHGDERRPAPRACE